MKRLSLFLLALLMLLSLPACAGSAPEPTAAPTPEPAPSGGVELWYYRAQSRYNMEYGGFGEYLSLMCDDFYGDSVKTILRILPMPDKDKEIEEKRAWYDEKYGSDWRYVISDRRETELDDDACADFAAELEDVCRRAEALMKAADTWSDAEWADFAEGMGCGIGDARELVEAYAAMADACRGAQVTRAIETEVYLSFSGSKTETLMTSEKNTLYEVNGRYVSEMLIDLSISILNLIY